MLLLLGCQGAVPQGPGRQASVPQAAEGAGGEGPSAAGPPRRFVSPHSYEWFMRAELLSHRGQAEAALRAYEMALAGAEEDAYVLSRYALALQAAGQGAEAERALQRALSLDPSSEAAWLARGRLADARQQLGAAVHAYERAETVAPHSPEPPAALAELLERRGYPERAVAVLQRYAVRVPDDDAVAAEAQLRLALAREDGAGLAAAAADYLARAPRNLELLRHTADGLLDAGRAGLALRCLEALPPRGADAARRLRALLADARFDQAETLLATTPPDELGGPQAVAEAYLQMGRPRAALPLLETAGALRSAAGRPDSSHRRLRLAQALLYSGDTLAAVATLERLRPSPEQAGQARTLLADALRAGGLGALADEVARAGGSHAGSAEGAAAGSAAGAASGSQDVERDRQAQ